MTLDVSQAAVILASAAATAIMGLAAWQLRRYATRQESSARRREIKQEWYYRKVDSVILAMMTAGGPIDGPAFKRAYEEIMKPYQDEKNILDMLS